MCCTPYVSSVSGQVQLVKHLSGASFLDTCRFWDYKCRLTRPLWDMLWTNQAAKSLKQVVCRACVMAKWDVTKPAGWRL